MKNQTIVFEGRNVLETISVSTSIAFVLLIALIGNILVILAILKSNTLRKEYSNKLIINLAMSDILNAVLVMLTAVISVTGDVREIPSIWCKLVCSFNYCLIIASMMTMFFIGVDRYFSIIYLFRHRDVITKYVIYGFITWSWIQGIAFGIVPPIIQGWVHYDYWEAICAIDWDMEGAVTYVVAAFTLCFAVPFFGLVFIYASIIKAAFTKSSKRLEENRAHKEIKLILSLFTIVVLFFIFMAPFCVTKLLKVIKVVINLINDKK